MNEASRTHQDSLPLSLARRVDEICTRFEDACIAGQGPCIEDFLLAAQDLEQPALLRELLRLELHYRYGRAENLTAHEYQRRFPQHSELISAFFAAQTPRATDSEERESLPETVSAIDQTAMNRPQRERQINQEPSGLIEKLPTIPGYELLGVLGRGGMGVVYRARQVGLKRVVALKMILVGGHAGPEQVARFRREAEAAARLQHPHIVHIHEIGEADGHPFFSLDHIDGGTLAEHWGATPQPARKAAELLETLARAVHYAHERHIIHRDLKPANVLLTQDGQPKITDFGLAKQLDDPAMPTQTGAIMGTPSYMAPEQALGRIKEIGPAADVYALGSILYEGLTGRPPFKGETVLDTLEQVRTEEPVPPSRLQPKLPRDLETICLKCLQKEPCKRYASAQALAEELRRFLNNEPINARPVGKWERIVKWAKRRPAVAALLTVSGLAGLGLLVSLAALWYNAEQRAEMVQVLGEAQKELGQGQQDLAAKRAEIKTLSGLVEPARQELEALTRELEAKHSEIKQLVLTAETLRAEKEKAAKELERTFEDQERFLRMRLGILDPKRFFHMTVGNPEGNGYLWLAANSYRTALYEVAHTWARNPDHALGLLENHARCPEHLRDFAWGFFHRLCTAGRFFEGPVVTKLTTPESSNRWGGNLAFSFGSKRLAQADGNSVCIWDCETGERVLTLRAPDAYRRRVRIDTRYRLTAFLPDGRHLAAVSDLGSGEVHFWDLNKREVVNSFQPDTGMRSVEVPTGQTSGADFTGAAISPDGCRLACAGKDGTVTIWDLATRLLVHTLEGHSYAVRIIAFSPDGKRIATAQYQHQPNSKATELARIWDARTGKLIHALDQTRRLSEIGDIAFSPNGQSLAVANSYYVKLFDVADGREILSLEDSRGAYSVAFSPDGLNLASTSVDAVRVWDTFSGRLVFTIREHTSTLRIVAFSPDGGYLASMESNGTIRLWRATRIAERHLLPNVLRKQIRSSDTETQHKSKQSPADAGNMHERGTRSLFFRGRLAITDPPDKVRGAPHKLFQVGLHGGEKYVIHLGSDDFNAFLRIEDASGKQLAFNDDSGGNLDSGLVFAPPRDDVYRIIATTSPRSYRSLGGFTLLIRRESDPDKEVKLIVDETQHKSKQSPVEAGKTHAVGKEHLSLEGRLMASDLLDKVRGGPYKVLQVRLQAGERYVIDLLSREFDAFLRIEDASGKQLAFDDDSGGNLNSRLIFAPPRDDVYRIIATRRDQRLGDFTLSIRRQ